MNLNYQRIIAMGAPVIPLILRELQKRPGDWFWALSILTDENPIPKESRGIIQEMADAWIEWGKSEGLDI